MTVTFSGCNSAFNNAYAGQEAGYYTEDCGTFSPTPNTGTVTGLTLTYTYTPLATPVNGRTRDYCDGGLSGSGDHIQYLASLSPQLTILVTTAVPDTTAPTLSSSSPADNATGVALASNIVLNFSEAVTAVAAKNIVIKKSDGTTVETIAATSSQVTISGSAVTINPTDDLEYQTGYYVLIDSGAFKDASNNVYVGVSSSTALNFTSVADTTAPTLSSSSPADNASGVALASNIVLNFSEAVTAVAAKNIVIKKSDGTTVETIAATSSQVTISGSAVTINPADDFDYLTGYYVLVDSGAFKDASNNVYAGISSSTALNFTSVADTTAPTLLSSSPADNATGVALASNIVLNFSKNVLAVSGKSLVIKKSDGTTVESISTTDGARVSISGSTVTINPGSPFQYSTGYYILIDAGAFRDSPGNLFVGITSSSTLNFTVVAETPTSSSSSTSSTTPTPTTVGTVSSSTTVAPAAPPTTIAARSTNSTVSTPRVVPQADATTVPTTAVATTTSTTTTSTLPKEVAPIAPTAEPGTATASINGVEVPMTITRVNNNLQVSSANLRLEIGIIDESGEIVPLDADGNAVVRKGLQIAYSVIGAQPGASLEAWLFSDPFKLGTVVVGEDGRAEGRLPVSVEVASGNHRLVMKTLTGGGEEATVAIGVVSGASGSPATVGRIIFVSLLAAIAVGLIIPATRRRRRKLSVTA